MSKTAMRVVLEREIAGNGVITLSILSSHVSESVKACGSYLVYLTNRSILTVGDGVYRQGRHYQKWLAHEPKTRPGGNATAYLSAKGKRDAQNMADFRALIAKARAR
jgi:hypothetical protein